MTSEPSAPTDRARELRDDFDAAFSSAPMVTGDPPEDFLAIRVGQSPYALRLSEIAGLYADKPVTTLPGTARALRGVAGFRGSIVAVYDLGVLLGDASDAPCRWMVVASAHSTVGLAFDQFDGHLRLDREAIAVEAGAAHALMPAGEAAQVGDTVRPIIQVHILLDAIKQPRAPGGGGAMNDD